MRTLLGPLRRAHRRVSAEPERGTTMIELFVAMILMTICGSIFTTAIITLYKATNQAQAITNSSRQGNQAYQTLDRTVRYTAAVSNPARSTVAGGTGDWYVELRNTTTGVERCTQLRVDVLAAQLQRRTWTVNADGTFTTPTSWLPLASGLTNVTPATTADQPFVLKSPTPNASHQILTVTLITRSTTAAGSATSSRSSFDLTAVNSTVPVASGAICPQAGRP